MDNIDLVVLRTASQWLEAGHPVILGTITRTWGSAPRPVGSLVALRKDGVLAGSVSGGCIEDDLLLQLRSGALNVDRPSPLRYGVGAEEARRFGLPCGGTLELVLEPLGEHSRLDELLVALEAGRRVRRTMEMATGAVSINEADSGDKVLLTDTSLISHYGPQWRLLIIGAGPVSGYLARMAQALDYTIQICDPRPEYQEEPALPNVTILRDMPDDVVTAFRPDSSSAIVALTHDPKLDDLALIEALRSSAFYVGAIGSRLNQTRRRERLADHFGLTERELARLHGPVGLPIGARTPAEIAVSVLAEMTACRYAAGVIARPSPPTPEPL